MNIQYYGGFFWSNLLSPTVPLHVWACETDSLWLVSQAWPLWWKVIFVTCCISDCSTAPLCDKLCVLSCCIASPVSQMWQPVVEQVPPFLSNTFPDPVCTGPKLKFIAALFSLSKILTQECWEETRGRRKESIYLKVLKRAREQMQTRHGVTKCLFLRACVRVCVLCIWICVYTLHLQGSFDRKWCCWHDIPEPC